MKNESDEIVEGLKGKNVDIEYMVFEDEVHGFTNYSNLVKALKRSAIVLEEAEKERPWSLTLVELDTYSRLDACPDMRTPDDDYLLDNCKFQETNIC